MTATTTPAVLADMLVGVIREHLPADYTLDPNAGTGGGCTAHIITAPDGRTAYVTDGDAEAPSFEDLDYYTAVFSYYGVDADGAEEEDGMCTVSFADAMESADGNEQDAWITFWGNVAVTVDSWVDGDPYTDMN